MPRSDARMDVPKHFITAVCLYLIPAIWPVIGVIGFAIVGPVVVVANISFTVLWHPHRAHPVRAVPRKHWFLCGGFCGGSVVVLVVHVSLQLHGLTVRPIRRAIAPDQRRVSGQETGGS